MRTTLVAIALFLATTGCNRLTAENYAKLRVGMTYDEAKALLGNPDQCTDALGVKSCMWGSEKRHIRVNFVGEKAVLYAAENVR